MVKKRYTGGEKTVTFRLPAPLADAVKLCVIAAELANLQHKMAERGTGPVPVASLIPDKQQAFFLTAIIAYAESKAPTEPVPAVAEQLRIIAAFKEQIYTNTR